MEDHLHALITVPPSASLSAVIKELKLSTGEWLRSHGGFPRFRYWQEGYGAFTKSWDDRHKIIEYIKNQDNHHRTETFLEEFQRMVREAGLEWHDQYLP